MLKAIILLLLFIGLIVTMVYGFYVMIKMDKYTKQHAEFIKSKFRHFSKLAPIEIAEILENPVKGFTDRVTFMSSVSGSMMKHREDNAFNHMFTDEMLNFICNKTKNITYIWVAIVLLIIIFFTVQYFF